MGASIYPLCQIQYDPYGTVVFGLSPSNHCEFGNTFVGQLYQNQRMDVSSGDYQLGSRTYDPSKNSFLSPDHFQTGTSAQDLSIEVDPVTENTYTFVDGDPVNRVDLSGHSYTTGDDNSDNQGTTTCETCYTPPTRYVKQTSHGLCATQLAKERRKPAEHEPSRTT